MSLIEQILLTMITTIATAIFAYFGFWRKAKAELQKEYESRFNEKKWTVYSKFVEMLATMDEIGSMVNSNLFRKIDDKAKFRELTHESDQKHMEIFNSILLIGSEDVVKKYLSWAKVGYNNPYYDEESVVLLVELINAMREDLGRKKSDIDYHVFKDHYYQQKKNDESQNVP